MTSRMTKKLEQLPSGPGVYRFFGAGKKLLYVGKAADLSSRVRSYFQTSADLSAVKRQMVGAVADIEWTETGSEIEALLLEANFIKKYQPKYNVLLRDDKSYQYINVTTDEDWPRVLKTRTVGRSGTYFGPFTSGRAVVETLKMIRKLFPYRCNQKPIELQRTGLCKNTETRSLRVRACFWYHIGLCPGTCIGKISKEDYRKRTRLITLFLAGRKNDVYRRVKKERGAEYTHYLDNVLAHARILSVGDQYANDVRELQRALRLVTPPRRIEGYDIANLMGKEATGAMVVFTDGEPDKNEYKKFKIKTVEGANDVAMLKEVLMRRLRHSALSLRGSASERSNLVGIASCLPAGRRRPVPRNDKWPLPDLMIIDGGKAQLNAAVQTMKKYFVEKEGVQNEPIVTKRTLSFLQIPVIAVAKGGHGGVLKQKEEIYFPGEKKPLTLSRHAPALHLVLRVRDETHRFAIGYHKYLRKKKMFR